MLRLLAAVYSKQQAKASYYYAPTAARAVPWSNGSPALRSEGPCRSPYREAPAVVRPRLGQGRHLAVWTVWEMAQFFIGVRVYLLPRAAPATPAGYTAHLAGFELLFPAGMFSQRNLESLVSPSGPIFPPRQCRPQSACRCIFSRWCCCEANVPLARPVAAATRRRALLWHSASANSRPGDARCGGVGCKPGFCHALAFDVCSQDMPNHAHMS